MQLLSLPNHIQSWSADLWILPSHRPSHFGPPTFHGFMAGPYLIRSKTNETCLDLQCRELGVQCWGRSSLHWVCEYPTILTEVHLLTTSQTRVIAHITWHSDCNSVTCHARKQDLRGWKSGGQHFLHGPSMSTSEHRSLDRVLRWQWKMAQNDPQRVWIDEWCMVPVSISGERRETSPCGRGLEEKMSMGGVRDTQLHNQVRNHWQSFK